MTTPEQYKNDVEKDGLLGQEIPTERLNLVPLSMKYRDEIFTEFDNEITTHMYPRSAKKISETEDFINEAMKQLKAGTDLQLAILDKDSNEFLGCAGLHHVDKKTPEFGVWVKKSAHGKALGREAMQALKKWADENLEYEYLLYPVAGENIASKKIAESMGGKIEREYDVKNMSGNSLHLIEYRIYNNKK